MRVFVMAMILSAAAFLMHWLWWRVRIPRRQTALLLLIFSTVSFLGVLAAWWRGRLQSFDFWVLRDDWEAVHVGIANLAIMLAYVAAYSAIEERSPSMTVLTRVADAGQRGRSREELQAMLLGVSPVEKRLSAMLRDGMVREQGGKVQLTAKGMAWAETFSAWRQLLRFRMGG
jgi:hypothetical protein